MKFAFKPSRRLRLAFGVLALGAATSPVSGLPDTPSVRSEQLIIGVDGWVPFEAKFRSVNGGVETRGTIYRASNGSERHDAESLGVSVTTILNIPNRVMYKTMTSSRPGSSPEWEMRPLMLPQAGYRPRTALARESKTVRGTAPVHVGRFSAWETVSKASDGTDTRLFVAPDLNFFPLRTESGEGKREVFDIAIGEPDPQLFELPPDARIGRTGPAVRLGSFTPQEISLLR